MLNINRSLPPSRRTVRTTALALLFLGAIGCGKGPVPVSGTVTLDGQPVHHAMVFFYPNGEGKAGEKSQIRNPKSQTKLKSQAPK